MDKKKDYKSALSVNTGITQPPSVNPYVLTKSGRKKRKKYSADEFVTGILAGDRAILSQAITLVESSLQEHYETAQTIIEKCLPYSSKSVRIGITGVPGAGKSTFIETFGLCITSGGRKLAVLTIDPSSEQTKGSILGDKTRMELLSADPNAYIRPTPTTGTLGGVSRKTRETIVLCEAAGFDTIIIETVGVGQSETEVHTMVDVFLLLMLAGAGDELQGIKRGIMEMADLVAITKADGANKIIAENARILYQNALHFFPKKSSGWIPQVHTCSARTNTGIKEILGIIMEYIEFTKKSGYFETFRKEQAIIRMHNTIIEYLNNSFYNQAEVKNMLPDIEKQLQEGVITSYKAAFSLLENYFRSVT